MLMLTCRYLYLMVLSTATMLGERKTALILISIIFLSLNQMTRKFGVLATSLNNNNRNEHIEYMDGVQHPIRSITLTPGGDSDDNKSVVPLLMYVGVNVLETVIGVQILASKFAVNGNNADDENNRSKF